MLPLAVYTCVIVEQSDQQPYANGANDPACAHSHLLPLSPPDNNVSDNEQREHACRLAGYLQRKTTPQVSQVEIGFNAHTSSQKQVLMTRTVKLIGSCLDDVIGWAKAIPGTNDSRHVTSTQWLKVVGYYRWVIIMDNVK